jgi:dihydroorotate dehydrogenase
MKRTHINVYHKLKQLAVVTFSGGVFFAGISIYRGDEKFYNNIFMPAFRMMDPETAHRIAVLACKYKLVPSPRFADTDRLKTKFLGMELKNPIGIAAGFDKHGEAVEGLTKMGFGFVEIGSVTPLPQEGNPKPRVFRLTEDEAIINRYGFNSDGHEVVYNRLRKLKNSENRGVLGVNLGKNKTSDDSVSDYVQGVELFAVACDYLVINVSSPNTPGLRMMQHKENLKDLLKEVIKARDMHVEEYQRPILLKLAPDLTLQEIKEVIDVIKKKECKVDGLIISNTSVDRNDLKSKNSQEIGGLSGKPIKDKTTKMIEEVYKLTNGKIPIVGVGGISDGRDAFEKITSGASVLQLYTSFVFHGPPVVTKIKRELDEILKENGYNNVQDAVGKSVQ